MGRVLEWCPKKKRANGAHQRQTSDDIAQDRHERRSPAVLATSAYYFRPKSTRVVAPLSLMPCASSFGATMNTRLLSILPSKYCCTLCARSCARSHRLASLIGACSASAFSMSSSGTLLVRPTRLRGFLKSAARYAL